jgi:two-component system OmpR family sensor kinase
MSVRVRSILAAALATMLAVVVLGSVVDVVVARHLHRSLDRTLRSRAVAVAQLAASAPALLTTPGALDSPVGATQAMVEVVDRRGRIVGRSLSLGGRVLPSSLARQTIAGESGSFRTIRFGDDDLRVYAAPLADVSGPAAGGAALVAASTSDISDTVDALHAATVLAAIAAAAIGALAVALLMRSALEPLARLARAAREIERTGDSKRRLPDPHRTDEVGALASTLNAMLDSLDRSREGERRFLADASHELRTPLTALRGNVAHLARHGSTPELVSELEADAERLARLADDLLTLSREEAARSPGEDVRLDELVHAVAAPDVDVSAVPVIVRGDRLALERALANLVENARRHGPPGGRVTVTAVERDGRALLSVEDEGAGVGALDREHAFERFWRARPDGRGSGLGLSIVRAAAERHGGSASVQGSRFTIDLPAVRETSETSGRPSGEDLEKGRP